MEGIVLVFSITVRHLCNKYRKSQKWVVPRASLLSSCKLTKFTAVPEETGRTLADVVGVHVDADSAVQARVTAARVALCLAAIADPAGRAAAAVGVWPVCAGAVVETRGASTLVIIWIHDINTRTAPSVANVPYITKELNCYAYHFSQLLH